MRAKKKHSVIPFSASRGMYAQKKRIRMGPGEGGGHNAVAGLTLGVGSAYPHCPSGVLHRKCAGPGGSRSSQTRVSPGISQPPISAV